MSGLPLVSIVTPSLNRAELLEKVLNCIRTQTYPHIEHIVVDGGSNDGTVDLLQRHEREGFTWISEPDTGMYNAVNKGFDRAAGEVLAYLNTDDLYFPYSVECAVSALEEHPDVAFVYGDMVNFTEEAGCGYVVFYPGFATGYVRRGGLIGQPTVFWRKQIARRIGPFDETLRLGADHEYWRRMSSHSLGLRLDEVLAYEGEHSDRLTSGQAAIVAGLAELESIRRRFDPAAGSPARRHLLDTWDRARVAFWYRYLTIRFLFWRGRSVEGPPGKRWQGFHRDRGFTVSTRRALLGLIPVVGRRFKRCNLTKA